MNYLGIDYDVKNMPVLDEGFVPFGVWMKAYLEGATQPIAVAVEREDGLISVRESAIAAASSPRPTSATWSAW